MKAMIFAAGLGTRLKPLTDNMPKAMVPVNGKPLLEHLILKMKDSGFDEIIVNVHHFPEQITDFLKENNNFGIRIEISDETSMLLETGGGLRKARAFFDEDPFLVHNVDILSNLDLKAFYDSHRNDALATLSVSDRATSRYLLFDEEMRLSGWYNRSTGETRPGDIDAARFKQLAFSGIQVASPKIFDNMTGFPDKFSVIDLFLGCMEREMINGYVMADFAMMDVGKVDTLSQAAEFINSLR